MSKPSIYIIHNDNFSRHVRGRKFLQFFKEEGFGYHIFYWSRIPSLDVQPDSSTVLLRGGGFGSKKLVFFYIIWIARIFFYFISRKVSSARVFFAVDFDSALPLYLISHLRSGIKYIYDIHDDFAMRYKWGKPAKSIVSWLDRKVRKRASRVIHVDDSRVGASDRNYLVVYNTPDDFVHKQKPVKLVKPATFVVSGLLAETRGMDSIFKFVCENRQMNLIIAGNVPSGNNYDDLFSLPNVEYLGYIPQEDLFRRIYGAAGIFSLYDPSLEINRKAASNKLYDAMMLGIPVISNRGLDAEEFIRSNGIGVCVSYQYDDTWKILCSDEFVNDTYQMGIKGRKLYTERFSFHQNFSVKLNDLMNEIIK